MPAPADATALASKLVEARRAGVQFAEAPAGEPETMAEAYAVQNAYIAEMGEPVVGWKAGFTNKAAQQAGGIDEPFAGPLFRSSVVASPAQLTTPRDALRIIECEFGFRMASDLPPRDAPYTQDAVVAAVASLHPAIEVVNIHVPGGLKAGPRWAVADGGGNMFWVPGAGTDDWQASGLPDYSIHVSLNGESQGDGTAAAALGNPVTVLTWLANHLLGRGLHLRAGDWVSTGLCTPLFSAGPGDRVTANYAELGTVEVSF